MTRAQLSRLLHELEVPAALYRLDGTHHELAHVLRERDGRWTVFLSARGTESDVAEFQDEAVACSCLLGRVCAQLADQGRLAVIEPDPLDVLTSAADSDARDERVEGYRRALAIAHSPSATYDARYMASARARALAGLARDGEVTPAEALAAAREAVGLGEACASLLAVAEMHFSFRDFEATRQTIMSVPRTCFGSELLFLWRFRLWDLRARSCFELGRLAEGFRYAERLVARMDRTSDPFDLELLPPYATTQALIDMADGSERAREILARMHTVADLAEWFPPDMAEAVRAAGDGGAAYPRA